MYLRWPAVTILMELMGPAASEPLVGVAMYTAEPGPPMPSEVAEGSPIWICQVWLFVAAGGIWKAYRRR